MKITFFRTIGIDTDTVTNTHNLAFAAHRMGYEVNWVDGFLYPWQRRKRCNHRGVDSYSFITLLRPGRRFWNKSKLFWKYSWVVARILNPSLWDRLVNQSDFLVVASLSLGGISLRSNTRILYNCHDAFCLYPNTPNTFFDFENSLLEKSSLVFTTSWTIRAHLLSTYEINEKKVINIDHGTDILSYKSNTDLGLKKYESRVIYVGSIVWLDHSQLKAIATELPNIEFLIIGEGEFDQRYFASNIKFIGPKKRHELRGFYDSANVGLILYKNFNELRESRLFGTNPMKLYDYLACGLHVVSNPLISLEHRKDVIFASDTQSFIEAINSALDQESEPILLKQDTWEEKIKLIINSLEA